MQLSDERVAEFKAILEKERGAPVSDEEAREQANNLARFADLIYEHVIEQMRRKRRLKSEPDGFDLGPGGYRCLVCRNEGSWFSKWGQTCRLCYRAFEDGVLPGFVLQNDKSSFRTWELKHHFKLTHASIRKYVKDGTLKPRIILTEDGTPYEQIFLKKENPCLVQRYNPVRKSYDRNKNKVSKRNAREEAKKIKEERLRDRKRALARRSR